MQQPENQSNLFSELEYDGQSKSIIRSMSGWALVAAITSLLMLALGIYQMMNVSNQVMRATEGFSNMQGLAGTFMGSSIISLIISLVLNILLLRFGTTARRQVDNGNAPLLGRSFGNLKAYFMIIAILVILVLAIILFALVVGISVQK